MLNTLRRRLIISQALIFVLIIPLMGLALVYVLESRVLLPSFSRQLKEQALLVTQLTNDHPEIWSHPDQAQALVDRVDKDVPALVMLLDNQGRILASSNPRDAQLLGQLPDHPALASLLAGQTSEQTDYTPSVGAQAVDIFMPVMGSDHKVVGVVRMAHPLRNLYDQFMLVRYSVAGVLGLALVLGAIASLILSNSLERPLREVVSGH